MLLIPPSISASWPAPNYKNPEHQGPALVIVDTIFLAACYFAVSVRLWTRIYVTRLFGLDDILLIVALIAGTPMAVLNNMGALQYGWDRHIWDIPSSWVTPSVKLSWASMVLYIISAYSTALSFLVFYERLNRDAHIVWFKWVNRIAIVVVSIIGASWFITCFLMCQPLSALWDFPVDPNSSCLDYPPFLVAEAILKVIVDFTVTTIPLALIGKMNMSTSRKSGAMILFALGYFITCTGVLRTYYTWQVEFLNYDTYHLYNAFLFGATEAYVAIIIAAIPPSRPAFMKAKVAFMKRFRACRNESTSSSQGTLVTRHQEPDVFAGKRYISDDLEMSLP